MRLSRSLGVALLACIPLAHATARQQPNARAEANDNERRGGILRNGVLQIHLIAQKATWYPEAEDGPSKVVDAFGEPGAAPRIPGPLIRIPLGTTIDATITNALADTLIVLGIGGRFDTLRIAPDQMKRVRHKPSAAGSYLYGASDVRGGKTRFGGTTGQLVGGLIVDPITAAADDRIFIATGWDPVPVAGNPYFLAMNGKSWPYTEKFVHTVGDTVRWRVLNGGGGSAAHHPMHLHGFYYRVDARGGWSADTLYTQSQQRFVVTENLPGLSSMSLTWVPTRPGNWLFHCHNADHIAGTHRHAIAGRVPPFPAVPVHDAKEHMLWDMSGLAHAITVVPRDGDRAEASVTPARAFRLLVQARPAYYGQRPGYGYTIQEGAIEPAGDSLLIPGPKLVLIRDQPVQITVVNRLPVHTAVHWHGIELESFYDGVAGWSGMGERVAPMIAPRDSFIVRFTPPRAGTFIYHAHMSDAVQLSRGLYGALLVVPPDQPLAADADHVMIVGFGRPGGTPSLLLNGSDKPAAMFRKAGGKQRIRLINITPENNVVVTLSADAAPIRWTSIAKDGFDLPRAQRRSQLARVHLFPGETYDFEFESSAELLDVRIHNPSASANVADISLQLRVRR